MLANKDSSSKKNDTKRGNFFTLFYVSLFGFIFLSGSMLSIPSNLQLLLSLGSQDAYAQEYYPPPQKGYDDKSYGGGGGGGDYYSNSYDSNSYNSYDSHDKKKNFAQIEREDNKLFICDNGIVVDDRINCPQKCPFNTPLEGVYVTDLEVCNIQPGVGVTCPLDTDLPGVVVTDKSKCNIFFECDATTPLGVSLQGQDVKVADPALCELSSVPGLQVCQDGPFKGFIVDDQDVCDTLDSVQICDPTTNLPGVLTTDPDICDIEIPDLVTCESFSPLGEALGGNTVVVTDERLCQLAVTSGTTTCPDGSTLEGLVVLEGQDSICNLQIPEVVTCESFSPLGEALGGNTVVVTDERLCQLAVTSGTTTCPAGSDLEGVVVLEENADVICNLNIPELFTCPDTSDIAGAQVTDLEICDLTSVDLFTCPPNSNMGGAVVTDLALCEAPDDDNKCPIDTDLAGVYVTNPDTDCTIFEECVSGDPIFSALPEGASEFKVVDDQICQLTVPEEVKLFECDPNSNLGEDALVTDPQLCNAATPAEQCPVGSTLEGVWVHPDEIATCNLVLPETCPPGTALEGVSVSNTEFCDLNGLEKCPESTDQRRHFVMGDGNLATTNELLPLCDLPEAEVCTDGTQLE
ncbi:MAG TPA: hypothetical protein VL854_12495, partial [Nitrososphaeraceae archaeon]|nr:hypothetical protein [Nitrososphaeraceae archaeon]